MPRRTCSELKSAVDWTEVLGICPDHPSFLKLLNQALPRLMNAGLYVDQTQLYRFCTSKACITLPRQFSTFEVVDVCNHPAQVRNQWFEFLENGPGMTTLSQSCSGTGTGGCHGMNVHPRGRGFAGFGDLTFEESRIRLFPTQAADAGKYITVRGYDSNGNWVLTSGGNVEGEAMRLAFPYVDSVTVWGKQQFRQVIKAITKGFVKAYVYDANDESGDPTLCPIASWEPSETLPDYRRYLIPAIEGMGSGCSGVTGEPVKVDVIARLQHVDVVSDLDILPIGNIPALKLGMLAIQKEERGDLEGARIALYGSFDPIRRRFVGGAIPTLEDELEAFAGSGTVIPLRITSHGRPNVVNLI
jgi:hypothetical protein